MPEREKRDRDDSKPSGDPFAGLTAAEREAIEATLGFLDAEVEVRRQAWLRRAHVGILALIVVAVSPFLWRAAQGVSIPSSEPRQVAANGDDGRSVSLAPSDPGEASPSPRSDASEREPEPYASLDEDLPSPSATMRATQRAVADAVAAYRDGGFLGWLAAARDCYDRLDRANLEQRIYCLQLDAAAYSMERGAPETFQAADAESDPYFTPNAFMARQLAFAPPNNPALSTDAQARRKRDVLTALAVMLNSAQEDALEREGVAPSPRK